MGAGAPVVAAAVVYGIWHWANALPDPATQSFREAATDVGISWRMLFLTGEQGETFKINLYDHGCGLAVGDFDGDGFEDVYFCNQLGPNALYRNRGDGTFEEVAAKAGVPNPANGMSVDWGDYDNDGHLDLYVANMYSKTGNQYLALDQTLSEEVRNKLLFGAQGNALYRNRGGGIFEETGRRLGANLAGWAWSSNFFDYDNDGWLDIHVANGFWAGELEADA